MGLVSPKHSEDSKIPVSRFSLQNVKKNSFWDVSEFFQTTSNSNPISALSGAESMSSKVTF